MQISLKIFWRHICSQANQAIVTVEQLRPRTSAGLVVAERVPGEVFTPCQSWQTLGLRDIRWKRNKAAKPHKYVDIGGNDRKDNFQNDTKRKCEIVQWEVEWYLLSSDWLNYRNFVFRFAYSSSPVTSVNSVPDLTKADRNRGGGGWSKLSIRHFTALLCCNKVWRTHHPLSLYYAQRCNCKLHIFNLFNTFYVTDGGIVTVTRHWSL